MKLIGKLKNQVEAAESLEEKKTLIADAGMKLTDDELMNVAGGIIDPRKATTASLIKCPDCSFVFETREKLAQHRAEKHNK